MALFQYRDALNTLEHVRVISENSGDPHLLAGLNINISSLFLQLGNVTSAAAAAERGIAYVPSGANPSERATLSVQLARVRARQNDLPAAERLFGQAIDAAYESLDPATAAGAWECLGSEYLAAGRLEDAERTLTEAFRLRTLFRLSNLNPSWQLALVRASQGNLAAANVLIDNAVLELKRPGNMTPPWNIYGARGRIRLLSANLTGALSDLRVTRDMAQSWRAEIIATDASRTAAESGLSTLFYSSLIQAGNQLYERTHDPALARETFEAVEENRAASLRALAAKGDDWRARLPGHYWELLNKLQAAELRVSRQGMPQERESAARVRSELEQLEAKAGSPAANDNSTALQHVRRRLDPHSVLLSFHLGEPNSWLWVVTGDRLELHPLPAKSLIAPAIRAFQDRVRENAPNAAESGAELYRTLFGSLSPGVAGHRQWLLSLDEDLFTLPFPALVPETRDASPVYLAQLHALQITPGALMLGNSEARWAGEQSFLGVGDPIYNRADPRWRAPSYPSAWRTLQFSGWTARADSSPAFARLWGSGEEIRSSARAWNAGKVVLLTGADASKVRLWNEIKARPAVIHFATHILEASTSLNTGWIALSLNSVGQPDFVDPAEISARAVPAKLVVLSGCSSGSAEVRTASGLMGLTRAFIAAGSGTVLATRWAT
ncbi:MAG: hypothetical protein JWO80_4593, partial [Bryobacterales bacterium]|nr:hypothetical protein [Bryobacterales bacterium]